MKTGPLTYFPYIGNQIFNLTIKTTMNWKNTYTATIIVLILSLLLKSIGYSPNYGFSIRLTGLIIPLIIAILHFAFVFNLNKIIQKGQPLTQRVKIFEYINYLLIAYYIFGIATSFFFVFVSNGGGLFEYGTMTMVIIMLGFTLQVGIAYLLFNAFKLRKQLKGRYSDIDMQGQIADQNELMEVMQAKDFNTIEERLVLCKTCTNRKTDMQRGMVCALNSEKASFTTFCIDYYEDEKERKRQLELNPPKKKAGFFGSWKAALLMSVLGFARAATRGFEEPMGLIFFGLGIAWLLIALTSKRN